MAELSQRKYAAHRRALGLPGGTIRAVQKALLGGRIHALPNGKIDPVQADAEWAANTDATRRRKDTPAPVAPAASAPLFEAAPAGAVHEPPRPFGIQDWPEGFPTALPVHVATSDERGPVAIDGYMAWKTEREQYEALQARLRYEREIRSVLPRRDVHSLFLSVGRIVAAIREELPTQVAPRLVGKSDLGEIETILRAALKDADTRIADECNARVVNKLADGDFSNSAAA